MLTLHHLRKLHCLSSHNIPANDTEIKQIQFGVEAFNLLQKLVTKTKESLFKPLRYCLCFFNTDNNTDALYSGYYQLKTRTPSYFRLIHYHLAFQKERAAIDQTN